MLHNIAGKGNGEVITQALLAEFRSEFQSTCRSHLVSSHAMKEVTAVQNLKKQFVALFAVFAHEG